jgi:hypothetical protein
MVDYITDMSPRHVVVDGSNIATEGRSLPSLAQLDQAVREFLAENPDDIVTVVVDASFGHRIDPSELPTFEEAEAAGEVVSPPAGAIGRGDAFLLRIAEKTGATVLSNDSFQEFHGEHEWVFEKGRLIGGKPVPGVGWIFTPRTPVRGPKSREAVKEAKRKKSSEETAEGATGLDLAASRGRGRGRKVERAIATATDEVTASSDGAKRRRRRTSEPPSDPINAPLGFITFIAAHRLGSEVRGVIDSFSSHGAFVLVEEVTCYVPLSAMGDPAPRSAREVVAKGEERTFIVQAFDPLRRGIELALPGFEHIAAAPTEETLEAEMWPDHDDELQLEPAAPRARAGRSRKVAAAPEPVEAGDGAEVTPPTRSRRRPAAASAPEAAPAELAAGAAAAEPVEPVPARRSRRRGPAPAEMADAGSDHADGAEAGGEAPKRRSPKKATEPEPAVAPVKKTRAAKKAVAAGRKPAGEPAAPVDVAAQLASPGTGRRGGAAGRKEAAAEPPTARGARKTARPAAATVVVPAAEPVPDPPEPDAPGATTKTTRRASAKKAAAAAKEAAPAAEEATTEEPAPADTPPGAAGRPRARRVAPAKRAAAPSPAPAPAPQQPAAARPAPVGPASEAPAPAARTTKRAAPAQSATLAPAAAPVKRRSPAKKPAETAPPAGPRRNTLKKAAPRGVEAPAAAAPGRRRPAAAAKEGANTARGRTDEPSG